LYIRLAGSENHLTGTANGAANVNVTGCVRTKAAPIAMSGLSSPAAAVEIAAGVAVEVKPFFGSTPSAVMLYRFEAAAGEADTALTDAQGFLSHKEAKVFVAPVGAAAYLYITVVDADGTALVGGCGANDYICREVLEG
jgi:hypothetical protein